MALDKSFSIGPEQPTLANTASTVYSQPKPSRALSTGKVVVGVQQNEAPTRNTPIAWPAASQGVKPFRL